MPRRSRAFLFVLQLGGYLDCADGTARSCGCGTWEADWALTTSEHETRLTTTPRITHAAQVAPVAVPQGISITL